MAADDEGGLLNVQGISTILQCAREWHVENEESQCD